jgi:hypothetical protein
MKNQLNQQGGSRGFQRIALLVNPSSKAYNGNMRKGMRLFQLIFLMVAELIQGCGAGGSDSDVSLYVDPALFGHTRVDTQSRLGATPGGVLMVSGVGGDLLRGYASVMAVDGDLTPPVSCIGLNVMGDNIASASSDEGSSAWNQYKQDVLAGDTCSYPGRMSNVVSVATGGTLTVKVPFGSDRVIQLVGYSGMNCNRNMSGNTMMDPGAAPGVYELGRTVASLFSSKPSVEIEFDTSVVDQIDSNETSPSVSEFIPDIRCRIKGDPVQQFNVLRELAGVEPTPTPEPSPTATPLPSPTATPSPSATPEPTATPVPVSEIECGANEAVVGVYGYAVSGEVIHGLGLKCAAVSAEGTLGLPYSGPSVGMSSGTSASTFESSCNEGRVMERVTGSYGSATYPESTVGLRYQCVGLKNGGGGLSSLIGGSTGTSFAHVCPAGQYLYGIQIGENASKTSTTFLVGIKCRNIP